MYWYLNSLCLSFLRYKMGLIIVVITVILVLGNKSVETFAAHDIATGTFKAICHSQCCFLSTFFSFFFHFLHLSLDEHAFFFSHRLQEDWNKQNICSNFEISRKDFNQLKLTLEYKIKNSFLTPSKLGRILSFWNQG